MDSTSQDIVDLLTEAAQRLIERMRDLGDDEWQWQPIADDSRVTIRWRLDHIAQTLGEQRNWEWLDGNASHSPHLEPALSATAAVATVESTFREFISLTEASAATLGDPIGAAAGAYGAATRRSLVLHICDELIHHAAEASLLRDLYNSR